MWRPRARGAAARHRTRGSGTRGACRVCESPRRCIGTGVLCRAAIRGRYSHASDYRRRPRLCARARRDSGAVSAARSRCRTHSRLPARCARRERAPAPRHSHRDDRARLYGRSLEKPAVRVRAAPRVPPVRRGGRRGAITGRASGALGGAALASARRAECLAPLSGENDAGARGRPSHPRTSGGRVCHRLGRPAERREGRRRADRLASSPRGRAAHGLHDRRRPRAAVARGARDSTWRRRPDPLA